MTVCKSPGSQTRDSGSEFLYMIMDSGAEGQAISHADWRHLDEPSLRPAQVRLRSAAGNDMGVIVSISVHGGCDAKLVVLSPLFTTATTKSLSSASKILSLGSVVEMKPTNSILHQRNDGSVLLQGSGKRDFQVIRVKTSEINAITILL